MAFITKSENWNFRAKFSYHLLQPDMMTLFSVVISYNYFKEAFSIMVNYREDAFRNNLALGMQKNISQ